jgi:heme-degrading monooxygenase HmoA
MILEVGKLSVRPEAVDEFEDAYSKATHVLSSAAGHIDHKMHRSLDVPGHYLLIAQWETLEAHMVGFRQSELFHQWRGIIGPYFAEAPDVEHYEVID